MSRFNLLKTFYSRGNYEKFNIILLYSYGSDGKIYFFEIK